MRMARRFVSPKSFICSGMGKGLEFKGSVFAHCNSLYEGTRSYRSLALERLTRSFLVSRAPGRRKRRGGVEFESNLQMEDRVKVNKQDCFVKFSWKRDGLRSRRNAKFAR